MNMEERFSFIKDEEGVKPIKEKTITITAKEFEDIALQASLELADSVDDGARAMIGIMLNAIYAAKLMNKLFGEDADR